MRRRSLGRQLGVGAGVVLAGAALTGCTSTEAEPVSRPSEKPLVYVSHPAAARPAQSFSAGSYVVGQDVQLGRYDAGGTVTGCRWIQRDGQGEVLDQNGADRPTQVLTLTAEGSQLVVGGDNCHFTLLS